LRRRVPLRNGPTSSCESGVPRLQQLSFPLGVLGGLLPPSIAATKGKRRRMAQFLDRNALAYPSLRMPHGPPRRPCALLNGPSGRSEKRAPTGGREIPPPCIIQLRSVVQLAYVCLFLLTPERGATAKAMSPFPSPNGRHAAARGPSASDW